MILLARPRITASFRHQCSAPISLLQIQEISLLNYPEQTFDHVDYHIITSSKIKRLNLKFHWNHFISSTSLCQALWTLLNFCLAQSSFFVLKSNLTKIHPSPPVQRFVGLIKAMLVVFIGWILNTCSKQMPDKESCWERWSPGKFLQRVRGREEETSGKCWPLLTRESGSEMIWGQQLTPFPENSFTLVKPTLLSSTLSRAGRAYLAAVPSSSIMHYIGAAPLSKVSVKKSEEEKSLCFQPNNSNDFKMC